MGCWRSASMFFSLTRRLWRLQKLSDMPKTSSVIPQSWLSEIFAKFFATALEILQKSREVHWNLATLQLSAEIWQQATDFSPTDQRVFFFLLLCLLVTAPHKASNDRLLDGHRWGRWVGANILSWAPHILHRCCELHPPKRELSVMCGHLEKAIDISGSNGWSFALYFCSQDMRYIFPRI